MVMRVAVAGLRRGRRLTTALILAPGLSMEGVSGEGGNDGDVGGDFEFGLADAAGAGSAGCIGGAACAVRGSGGGCAVEGELDDGGS